MEVNQINDAQRQGDDYQMAITTGAQSRGNEVNSNTAGIVNYLVPLSEFALMNEIYSGGAPSPKQ